MNQKDPWTRTLLVLLVLIALSYLGTLLWQAIQHFSTVILLFLFSWLIAFILSPLVRLLMVYNRVPRILAIVIVYLGLIVLTVLGAVLIVPILAAQLAQLGATFPLVVEQAPPILQNTQGWLESRDITIDLSYLYQQQSVIQRAESIGTALAQNAIGIAQGILSTLFNAIIVLILSFYIMVDGGRIASAIIDHLSPKARPVAHYFTESVERTFGGYMRGALIQAVIYGLGTTAVMLFFGLNYSVAVGVFAGIILIIPFVGSFIALVPPLLIALSTGSWTTFFMVTAALLALQQVVLNFIAPKVMSENVGIHPLLVFLAVLVGAQEAGFVGAILGVPIAAVLYSMLIFFLRNTDKGLKGDEPLMDQTSGSAPSGKEPTETGGQDENTQGSSDSGRLGHSLLTSHQSTAKGDFTPGR